MKTATLAMLLVLAGLAQSVTRAADWQMATLTGAESADAGHMRCHYRALSGYEFSIVSTLGVNACPASVQVDLETGQVRR
jgi:hypothetical protein